MKKMFRRLTAMTITMVLLFSLSVSAIEIDNNAKLNPHLNLEVIEEGTLKGGYNYKFFKLGESFYFHASDGVEIIAVEMRADGTVEKHIRDTRTNEVQYFISYNDQQICSYDVELQFELVDIVVDMPNTSLNEDENIATPFASETQYILYQNKLKNKHGDAYSGKLKSMYTQNSKTCKIYENHYNNVNVYDHIMLLEGLEFLSMLDMLVNPPSEIIDILPLGPIDGVTCIVETLQLDLYEMESTFTQLAQIDNVTQAVAGKEYRYGGYGTIYGITDLVSQGVATDQWFDNFSTLASIAFDVYFN